MHTNKTTKEKNCAGKMRQKKKYFTVRELSPIGLEYEKHTTIEIKKKTLAKRRIQFFKHFKPTPLLPSPLILYLHLLFFYCSTRLCSLQQIHRDKKNKKNVPVSPFEFEYRVRL